MPRTLDHQETATPRAARAGEKKKAVSATPKPRRETLKGLALARRLQAAADRHDAGQTGEDVTGMSSADFIARLRR